MLRCREQQGILANFLYLNMYVGCEEKTCTKVHYWILEQMKCEKIAIFGQKVPKNLYLSNKYLLPERGKEYKHTVCN